MNGNLNLEIPRYSKDYLVTPRVAKIWLDTQVRNRPVMQSWVDTLAQFMVDGSWSETGEPIKFDVGGHLIDGQHRLCAIIKSGANMRLDVKVGLSPDAQFWMDSGKGRSNAQTVAMCGYTKSPSVLSATVHYVHNFMALGLTHEALRIPMTKKALVDFLEVHPRLADSVAFSNTMKNKKLVPQAVTAAAHYITMCQDPALAKAFWDTYKNMETSRPHDPALALRNAYTGYDHTKHGGAVILHACKMVFKAWNLYKKGIEVKRLRLGADEEVSLDG